MKKIVFILALFLFFTCGTADKKTVPVDSPIPPKEVAAIINRNNPEILSCYEKGLRKDPDLKGTIEVSIVVTSRGSVTMVDVKKDTVGSTVVLSCIIEKVMYWRFPQFEGDSILLGIPFIFEKQ